jgi:hypothetical protein
MTRQSTTPESTQPIIRTLDDVTLVPTPVTLSTWPGGGRAPIRRTEEHWQATLFTSADRRGRPVTMVSTSAMTGDPVVRLYRLQSATIGPRPPGGWSPWELRLVFMRRGVGPAASSRGGVSLRIACSSPGGTTRSP